MQSERMRFNTIAPELARIAADFQELAAKNSKSVITALGVPQASARLVREPVLGLVPVRTLRTSRRSLLGWEQAQGLEPFRALVQHLPASIRWLRGRVPAGQPCSRRSSWNQWGARFLAPVVALLRIFLLREQHPLM